MPVDKLFFDEDHEVFIDCFATIENKLCIRLKCEIFNAIDLDIDTAKEFIKELITQYKILKENEEGGTNG